MHEGEGEIHPKQEKQSKREQEKRRRESAREKKKYLSCEKIFLFKKLRIIS